MPLDARDFPVQEHAVQNGLQIRLLPDRWPVVGWMADLNRISRADCERYFRTYYAPNNCTLVLVGDFDAGEALQQIERLYGSIPSGDALPLVPDGEPPQKGERRAVIRYPSHAPAGVGGV